MLWLIAFLGMAWVSFCLALVLSSGSRSPRPSGPILLHSGCPTCDLLAAEWLLASPSATAGRTWSSPLLPSPRQGSPGGSTSLTWPGGGRQT